MSCRRICSELISQARFGELGPGAAPHLEHLTDCRTCRDELGFDRALVRQLRVALAERIDGAGPSALAWEGVLQRMASPEPASSRLRTWSTMLIARLRVGSAMAGATLAILVTLNFDVVPVRPSDALHDAAAVPSATAPPRPLTLADGFAQPAATAPYAVPGSTAQEPATAFTSRGVWLEHPEDLPILGAREGAPAAGRGAQVTTDDSAPARAPRQPLSVRLVPADAALMNRAVEDTSTSDEPPRDEPPMILEQQEGAPS